MKSVFGFTMEDGGFYIGDRVNLMDSTGQVESITPVEAPDCQGGRCIGKAMNVLIKSDGNEIEIIVPLSKIDLIEVLPTSSFTTHIANRAAYREAKLAEKRVQQEQMQEQLANLRKMVNTEQSDSEDSDGDNIVDMPNGSEHGPAGEDLNPDGGVPPVVDPADEPGAETMPDDDGEGYESEVDDAFAEDTKDEG